MESKFHRWWLGSCLAALLLASWAGGFSVVVTAVFIVIYLTGVALVGPDDEADIGLAAEPPQEPVVAAGADYGLEAAAEDQESVAEDQESVAEDLEAVTRALFVAPPEARDASDGEDAEPYPDDEVEVEAADEEKDDAETEALHTDEEAGEPERSPA